MRINAIIPAKGKSTRLPGKNLLPFGDSTLVGHKIDQLKRCSRIDRIVVGSDSDDVLHQASLHGAECRRRDARHCDEKNTPLRERLRNLVAMVECDVVVWAHCTNPLCLPDLYDAAVRSFIDREPDLHDSLCSVTPVQRHAWESGQPANFDPWGDRHPFASELPTRFYQDGAIFIQPHLQMLENAYFYGRSPLLFGIDQPFGWDIDNEHDLSVARHLYRAMREEVLA